MRRLKIFTWHIHGNYLYYLSQCRHDFYVPSKDGRPEGYGGRCGTLPWPANLIEIPAAEAGNMAFDCILFQSHKNYLEDQYEILSEEQRRLPRLFLEHDPPRQSPTDTRHPVDDANVLLVHCTHFNDLMWDSNRTPTRVVEHGVMVPAGVQYSGELPRGIAVVNGLRKRGRRLGVDVFERVRKEVPIDLAGMGSHEIGGIGEIPWDRLTFEEARYRFFFNPIRYTSLGLSVLEAMMAGLPILGLATTEMVAAVDNGVNGFVETDVNRLVAHMKRLLNDRDEARALGQNARRIAIERYNIERFKDDWDAAFCQALDLAGQRFNQPVETGVLA